MEIANFVLDQENSVKVNGFVPSEMYGFRSIPLSLKRVSVFVGREIHPGFWNDTTETVEVPEENGSSGFHVGPGECLIPLSDYSYIIGKLVVQKFEV